MSNENDSRFAAAEQPKSGHGSALPERVRRDRPPARSGGRDSYTIGGDGGGADRAGALPEMPQRLSTPRRRAVDVSGREPKSDISSDPMFRRLQRQVSELEREVAVATRLAETKSEDTGTAVADARWSCSACGSLLGFYNSKEDVLRVRYKDHMLYVRVGVGGFVQVICRGCGAVNIQEYVESVGDSDTEEG